MISIAQRLEYSRSDDINNSCNFHHGAPPCDELPPHSALSKYKALYNLVVGYLFCLFLLLVVYY
jgi:hypothetical protein